jgi:predicted DCC family thiol-disulfide oxidoreductase YuxK
VRFVAATDHAGAFHFAPLGGETFLARVPPAQRPGLPDSIVVWRASDGALLVRSDAVIHVLLRVGGGWSLLGAVLDTLPRRLRDAAYDFVALRRAGWFPRPEDSCPVVPPRLRARFVP